MRERVIEEILRNRLIVIVRGVAREKLIPMAEALYRGGVRLMELTYSANGARSDDEVAEDIRLLCKRFEGRMMIGAGTVLTEAQVELTCRAGGLFVISPDVNEAVISRTVSLGMVSIPGALTPSEVQCAHRAGADFIKLFPVSAMGAGYLKALRAPLSHVRFLAVGGINEHNLDEYFAAGACGIGIGGSMTDPRLLAENDFASIEVLASDYVERIKAWQTT